MELMRAVMLNVIVIAFLTTLLDILLPDGTMRSYLKMTMGFFIVLTLLQPVTRVLQPDGMLQQWQMTAPALEGNIAAVQGEIYEQQKQQMNQIYQQKMEEQIRALLLLSTEMAQFQVSCEVEDYCLQQIEITALPDETVDSARIVQAISGYYGLEPSKIIVKTEEAGQYALE